MRNFVLLAVFALSSVCYAEDGNNDGGNDDAYYNANDNAGDDVGSYSSFQVCSDANVTVTGIEVVCDSPGTFYYGSGAYRNSQSCQSDDKGKVVVYFDVEQDIQEYAYVTLNVTGGGQDLVIYDAQELCSLKNQRELKHSYLTSCGGQGSYKIIHSFYWNLPENGIAYDDDGQTQFTPTMNIGFSTSAYSNTFNLGGANIDNCAASSYLSTVENFINNRKRNDTLSLLWSFGMLLGTLLIIGLFIFVLANKAGNKTPGIDDLQSMEHDNIAKDTGSFDKDYISMEEHRAHSRMSKGDGLLTSF